MRIRSVGLSALTGLALATAGCDSRDPAVARAAGAHGSSVELPIPAPSPPVPATPDARPAAPGNAVVIGFPQGGATLDRDARSALDRLAADPAAKASRITLRGHSDSEGDDAANRRMSRRRADAVRDYLAKKGLNRTGMTVIALGETRPIAPNAHPDGSDDSAGRARNRRVEIELDPAI